MENDFEAAINDLGEWLYFCMGALDPDTHVTPWSSLNEDERSFYSSCVEMMLCKRDLLLRAISDYDIISRGRDAGK